MGGMRYWAIRLSRMVCNPDEGLLLGPGPSWTTMNGLGARLVLGGNVDGDRPLVVDVVRLDDQRLRVARIDLAELLAGDAGIQEFRLLRVDHELLHLPLRHALHRLAFRHGDVLRPDDEIVVRIERGGLPLVQHLERRGTLVVVVAYWLCHRQTGGCETCDQDERGSLYMNPLGVVGKFRVLGRHPGVRLLTYSRSSASVRLDLIRLPEVVTCNQSRHRAPSSLPGLAGVGPTRRSRCDRFPLRSTGPEVVADESIR